MRKETKKDTQEKDKKNIEKKHTSPFFCTTFCLKGL